jgi:solute:Na+ symporter, SSS family
MGCIAGVVTVLVNGVVNDAEGGLFDYFWLRNNAICALCGSKTMVSFIITPLVSGFVVYLVSFLDILVRGDRAKQPLIPVPFDKEKDEGDDEVEEVNEVEKELTTDVEVVADGKAVSTESENEKERSEVIEMTA